MAKAIRVSQLNNYIKKLFDSDVILSRMKVVGEISGFKVHGPSGHVYFTLKDNDSKINCFMPKGVYRSIHYTLEDGLSIVVDGRVSVYEKGGYYSFQVANVAIEGQGNLSLAFEKLKIRLEAEGLFDTQHKKPLPWFPKKIALVTSGTGAAIDDMLRIIKLRNSYVDILICPVLVQGEQASRDIAQTLALLNERHTDVDVIICGRGGGSIEDLWAFNEEILARAIYDSQIPIISAVGHEIDFTISDFVADRRAQTPTEAASIAVPDLEEINANLEAVVATSKTYLARKYERNLMLLEHKNPRVLKSSVMNRILPYVELIDNKKQLSLRMIRNRIQPYEDLILEKRQASLRTLTERINRYDQDVEHMMALSDTKNPKSILSRGYSVLMQEQRVLASIKQIKVGDKVHAVLSDGTVNLTVDTINK
ncbi:MAG: exodeoxyribonuclease VII large subunit [Clostridiales Family XIII bacterium]|jgi:exodeoxyribonuclease VII large subunit|nr:exodeoxyribonuclease VII large subunit [Clostridiales Family XIII bacterium]